MESNNEKDGAIQELKLHMWYLKETNKTIRKKIKTKKRLGQKNRVKL